MEACQRCHEVDDDRRTLIMSCFYEMDELRLPFKHEYLSTHIQDQGQKFYTLRVCKECRADWLHAIQDWFGKKPEPPEPIGSGIYIRDFGATREISDEEWVRLYGDEIQPVRFKEDK